MRPSKCSHEMSTVDMSGKGNIKSECDISCLHVGHTIWTNCKEMGYCTLAELYDKPVQLQLDISA